MQSSENISEEELKRKEMTKDADNDILYNALKLIVNTKNFEDFLNKLDHTSVSKLVNGRLSKHDDMSLLHFAVMLDNEMVVRDLIRNGAPVNAVSKLNMTPLHFVRSVNVAKVLIENNADITAVNDNDENVLGWAYLRENFELATFLLEQKNTQLFHDALMFCGLPPYFSEDDFIDAMRGDDLVFNQKPPTDWA